VTAPAARRRPAGRYDPPSLLGQRVLAVLLALLFVALLAAVASFAWSRYAGEQVRGQVRGFEVLSDEAVEVDVEVAKTAGAAAFCVLRAQAADQREVGRDIAVVAGTGTPQTVARGTFVVATSRRAVSAELIACTPDRISRDDPAP